MGYVFKFLLYFFVISWLIRTVMRLFTGGLTGSQQRAQQSQQQRHYQQRQNEGKIHVDYSPKQKKDKSSDNFRGGEYVDYEEVD